MITISLGGGWRTFLVLMIRRKLMMRSLDERRLLNKPHTYSLPSLSLLFSEMEPLIRLGNVVKLANGIHVNMMSAKELIRTPVWKNNRIIDHGHVAEIQNAVDPRSLDHGYHVAVLIEEDAAGVGMPQRYIIDGQHRACVIRKYFEEDLCVPDFPVLVYERQFTTEGALIEHFNAINKCKPLQPWLDENLIVSNYIYAIEQAFDNSRTRFIRPGGHRPYLANEKLRDVLRANVKNLIPSKKGAEDFATRIKAWNDAAVANDTFVLGIRSISKRGFFEKGVKIGFVLAYDDRFPWIAEAQAKK